MFRCPDGHDIDPAADECDTCASIEQARLTAGTAWDQLPTEQPPKKQRHLPVLGTRDHWLTPREK